jgi:UDP-N-acetylglucosamine 2-epimerase (non-hydrolysing)
VICTVYGTTGELIKLAPVLTRLRDGGHPFLQATTGQQVQQLPGLLEQLGLPQPDLWLGRGARGRDLERNRDLPGWLAGVCARFGREHAGMRRRLAAGPGRALVLVHGDTMTTVLGTVIGKVLRIPVAHVEAGVRTWDVLHPFPEELNRRLVSRLADVHYAPGPDAAANLRRGAIVDTGANTIRDSLDLVPDLEPAQLPGAAFGIVSLHRYELLRDEALLQGTIELLRRHAEATPMLFVEHPVTVAALRRFGLDRLFGGGLRRTPRLDFFGFVALLRRAAFAVTDSGGTQIEAAMLDKPCLVHRKLVEQQEGVGESVVVSGLRLSALDDFLTDPGRFRRRQPPPALAPSDAIVADLAARGFIVAG